MMIALRFVGLASLFGLVGCSVIDTRIDSANISSVPIPTWSSDGKSKTPDKSAGKNPDGVAYYLPKNMMKITVDKKAVTPAVKAMARATADKAEKEKKKREEEQKSAEEDYKNLKVSLDQATKDKNETAIQELKKLVAIAGAKWKAAILATKNAIRTAAITKASADALQALPPKVKFTYDVKVVVLPATIDDRYRLTAMHKSSIFREDEVSIEVDKGLIKTVNTTATDRTPDIVVTLAKIAIAAFKIAAVDSPVKTSSKGIKEVPPAKPDRWCPTPDELNVSDEAFHYEKTFDPADKLAVFKINVQLCRLGTEFFLEFSRAKFEYSSNSRKPANVKYEKYPEVKGKYKRLKISPIAGDGVNGILYRVPILYNVNLKRGINGSIKKSYTIQTNTVALPNEGPIRVLPFKWASCVTTKYGAVFENGMLVKRTINRPSSLAECLKIPLQILQEIISLPTELIQLKIDYSSKQEELINAQRKIIEANESLRKAIEQQNNSPGPGTVTPVTP